MVKPDMQRGHDLAMGLRMAYWALHRRTDESLAKRNVTANQFVVLALLMEEDRITQQDLVLRASSDPSTIRAMLVLLERKGLVARNQHARDGRARCVTLTHKGRRAYKQMWTLTQRVRERLMVVLDPGETFFLVERLGRIAEAMISSPMAKSFPQGKINGAGDYSRAIGNDDVTVPGSWECPQCGFTLNRTDLKGGTGAPNDGPYHCPNDGQRLNPETWKERCGKLVASCEQLLTEIQWLNDFCAVAPQPKLRLAPFSPGNLRQLAQAGLEAPIKCRKCGRTNAGPAYRRAKSGPASRAPAPPERWVCESCGEPFPVLKPKRRGKSSAARANL
ncbi:MAG TPA: MarR family transcriptional regulator [Verrucomicrobiae bacterium]|nr:MarR family transcriptional regulator [Verrucomicrobiae bacterium]